jgi:predicted  nucleic acid-binding Zn-ribbon protein
MMVQLRGGGYIALSRPMFLDNSKRVGVIFNCIKLLIWGIYLKISLSDENFQLCNLQAKASENSYVEALKQRKEIEEALAKEKEELEKMKNQCDEVKEELQIALDQKSSLERQALNQRKENEEALAKEKKELEKMKNQLDKVVEELQIALDQKSSLERQFAVSEQMVKELEQKIISAVELLETYEKEKDELQTERDNALEEAEELRKKQEEASSTNTPQFFSEFSFSELEEATRSFDPSLKIGEGGYGNIYKGVLRHTQVAIKMLYSHSLQGPSEFQQEVRWFEFCVFFFEINNFLT